MTEAGGDATPGWDPDLIPDLGPDTVTDWPDLTGFIKAKVPIRTVYTTFVPKANGIGRPVSGGKETFIRCPSPSHVDKRPSAWMQEGEGLWYCAACAVGGDVFDLAAHATGHNVPGYKSNAGEFGDVVKEVAERLGVTEEQARAAGYTRESKPIEEADVSPEWPEDFSPDEMAYASKLVESWAAAGVPNAKELAVHDVVARRTVAERDAEVKELAGPEPEPVDEGSSREMDIELARMSPVSTDEVSINYEDAVAKGLLVEVGCDPDFPHIPWQGIFPEGSPLHEIFKAACVTDIPDEFIVWAVYTALGSLVGRRVELLNGYAPVDPSFWTVLMGGTGSRKSTVAVEMDKILAHVAPVSGADGVKIVGTPASGERYMEMIRRDEVSGIGTTVEVEECTNSASFMFVDEFSTLGTLLGRAGNTLSSHLLQTYSCGRDRVIRPTEAMGRVSFPVTGPMVSILATTQPNRVVTMLNRYDVASGFMNRFVFISGKPRRICVPMMGFGPDWKLVQEQFQRIENRLRCANEFVPLGDKAFVDKPWQLTADSGGLKRLREWMMEQNSLMTGKEDDEFTADLLARRDLVMVKLILLMALNRIVGEGVTKTSKNWTKADVDAAIAHYPNIKAGWLDTGTRVLDTPESELEKWIEQKINTSVETPGIAQNDLRRLIPKSMRVPAHVFNQTVNALAISGAFRQIDLRKVGAKRSIRWLQPNTVSAAELPEGYTPED